MPHYGLTKQMAKLLEIIENLQNMNGCSPSYDEMAKAMGSKSRSCIHRLLYALKERGAIDFIPKRSRSLVLKNKSANSGAVSSSDNRKEG